MRQRLSTIAWLLALLAPVPARASWGPTGAPVCDPCLRANSHHVVADGKGGLYVAWRDGRDLATANDVLAQHLALDGSRVSGWPIDGLPICNLPQDAEINDATSDGFGGIIVTWYDLRTLNTQNNTYSDIYAQRILPDGSLAPGWLPQGMPATRAPDIQTDAVSAPDGAGGAYFAWEDYRDYAVTQRRDVYAQHLSAAGTVAPGWPADGRPVNAASHWQESPVLAPDAGGGVYAAWWDFRDNPTVLVESFGSHLQADGTLAPGWTANGDLFAPGASVPLALVPAPGGDVYLLRGIPIGEPGFSPLLVQRITPSGAPAPGWPAEGVVECDAPGYRVFNQAVGDGFGGLLLSWNDYARAPGQPGGGCEVYVTRVRPDGTLPPGWPANGLMVSDATRSPYCEWLSSVAPDGGGGLFVAWERDTSCCTYAMIQHVTAAATLAPGWLPGGKRIVGVRGVEEDPKVVSDEAGGAIVVWREFGSLRAQRYGADGVVAAEVALVHAEGHPDRVELTWHTPAPAGFNAALERRAVEGEWTELARLTADGTGRIEYVDRAVTPASRYGYRLRWSEQGTTRYTAETWVETAAALAFSLEGPRPNPSVGLLAVTFTLPGWANGELELVDVAGRRVLAREVGSLGPGEHVLRLDGGAPLAPGLYLVRLRWGVRVATARVALIR